LSGGGAKKFLFPPLGREDKTLVPFPLAREELKFFVSLPLGREGTKTLVPSPFFKGREGGVVIAVIAIGFIKFSDASNN